MNITGNRQCKKGIQIKKKLNYFSAQEQYTVNEWVQKQETYDRCKWYHKMNVQYANNYNQYCLRNRYVTKYEKVPKVLIDK